MTEKLYRKFTQDVGVLVITDAAMVIKGLFVLPIMTKLLGASAYGIWIQSLVTVSLLATFCDLNLSAALARFLAAEKDKGKIREGFFTVTSFCICAGTIIAITLVLLSNLIAEALFHQSSLASVVVIIAIIIPLYELNAVAIGFYRAFREIKTYSWFIIGREFLILVVLVPLVMRGFGVYGALLAVLTAYFAVNAVMFYLIISRIGFKFPQFAVLKPYLRFSLPSIPNVLSHWLVSSSDRYVIGFILGSAAVGIYSASYGLGFVVSYFSAPLAFILIPTLSKYYDEENISEVKTHLTYSLKYFLTFAIPAIFGLSVLAEPLLSILATAEFVSVAAVIVPLVAIGYLFWGVYIIYSQVFVLIKRVNIIGVQWTIAAVLNLVLNLVFVSAIGVVGSAIATTTVYFLIAAWLIIVSRKHLRFAVEWRFVLKSLAAAILMSLLIWRFHPEGIPETALSLVLGVAVYFAVLVLLRGFKRGELAFFKSLLRRRV